MRGIAETRMIPSLIRCSALVLAASVALTTGQENRQSDVARVMASTSALREMARGLQVETRGRPRSRFLSADDRRIRRRLSTEVNRIRSQLQAAVRNVTAKASRMGRAQARTAFGPFMTANKQAQRIAREGAIFTNINREGVDRDNLIFVEKITCPFRTVITCNSTSAYRTIDGSCNNLQHPMWGKANTPFDRFLPPHYGDGFNSPRNQSVFRTTLPLPRKISTEVHKASTTANQHPNISHMTMEFGQFVSHDLNGNTLSTGENGTALSCCTPDGRPDNDSDKKMLGCLPIEIPTDDPHFSRFNRTCMNFVRAAPTPDINCDHGYREQLNQVTQFLDASTIYGSDVTTGDDLRTKVDGLLKVTSSVNGDLMLQNPAATGTPGCRTTGSEHCFKTGEARANQQPALMTLHTLFMREHNRVARELKTHNPSWEDETLFQEARKIVGAELQHITYNHFLPTIMGNNVAQAFGFPSQDTGSYYNGYDATFKPGIRNAFAAAAYRFGHGNVRDHFATEHLFKDHFLKPEVMYQNGKGPSFVLRSLIRDNQQGSENLISTQLTNHLFEKVAGSGLDLASINIKRGRDHGIASYNTWRVWCGLSAGQNFSAASGGLSYHRQDILDLLSNVYSRPDDIDLWTGIVTETPLEGGAVGPTGACLIGRQFWVMKHSDRFYYELDLKATRFKIEQLDEIRKASLARIICDNSDIITLPANVFEKASSSNPSVQCSSLPEVDLSQWGSCEGRGWSNWSAYTRCFGGYRQRTRTCDMSCAELCDGNSFQLTPCPSVGTYPGPSWMNRPRQNSARRNVRQRMGD